MPDQTTTTTVDRPPSHSREAFADALLKWRQARAEYHLADARQATLAEVTTARRRFERAAVTLAMLVDYHMTAGRLHVSDTTA